MSRHHDVWRSGTGAQPFGPWGCGARAPWRAYEVAAVVAGFFLFWRLGVAMLLLKFAQRSFGYEGDMFDFARAQVGRAQGVMDDATSTARDWSSSFGATGNSAFDDWRRGELTRLEEERRKLAQAERDFADHIEQLRRARDREEFDSFMRSRKGSPE